MKRGHKIDDNEILNGLRKGDSEVLDYIYVNYFKKMSKFIINHKGNKEDAKDVFQDALLIIYQKFRKQNVKLNGAFESYFKKVCWFVWNNNIKKRDLHNTLLQSVIMASDEFYDYEKIREEVEKNKLFYEHLNLLDENCRKVMELFEEGKSLKEIAEIMDISSADYLRLLKHRCKERLVSNIKNDPRYSDIY